tara:strand:+ start:405 stop:575 length:171 start_codon:yes stop_codon:yes gene_type:complete
MKGGKRVDNCVKNEEMSMTKEVKSKKKKKTVEVMPRIDDGKDQKEPKKGPDIYVKN